MVGAACLSHRQQEIVTGIATQIDLWQSAHDLGKRAQVVDEAPNAGRDDVLAQVRATCDFTQLEQLIARCDEFEPSTAPGIETSNPGPSLWER